MELTKTESEIIQKVSNHFKIPVDRVYTHCRKRDIVEARHFLIVYFVLELSHDIRQTTTHFGCLGTSNFYHGLYSMVSHHKFNRVYRQKLSSLFPLHGATEEGFIRKIFEKQNQLDNERAAARY